MLGTLSYGLAHKADPVGIWMPFSSCMRIYRNPVKKDWLRQASISCCFQNKLQLFPIKQIIPVQFTQRQNTPICPYVPRLSLDCTKSFHLLFQNYSFFFFFDPNRQKKTKLSWIVFHSFHLQ